MKRLLVVAGLTFILPPTADAQSCAAASPAPLHCAVNAAHVMQPALAITAAAGNPIPGASSTLGMRLGTVPRITVAGRFTGAWVDVPDTKTLSANRTSHELFRSLNLDVAVGLFSGFSLAPTIGGFGSIDVIASAGKVSLPDEFNEDPTTWAIGARIGILRESFTAPGVSISGLYRRIGDVSSGSASFPNGDAHYGVNDNSVLSVRAVAGKRLFVVGANIGIGLDKMKGQPFATAEGDSAFFIEGLEQLNETRATAFANLTWTMLILNVVAEGGYQRGSAAEFAAGLPESHRRAHEGSTYYGSLAIRLAL